MKPSSHTYTENQLHALEATDRSMAVIAGAGSGKTSVLVGRMEKVFTQSGKTDHVLAITFTEKAAREIIERLEKKLTPSLQLLLSEAWIGTFHHFCARLLRLYGFHIGVQPQFTLLEENQAQLALYRFLEKALLQLLQENNSDTEYLLEERDFPRLLKLFHELMSFRWQALHTLQAQQHSHQREQKFHQALLNVFKLLCTSYDQHRHQEQALHFQDLELLTYQLLQEKPELRHELQKQFEHIFVDEFQDTNDLQTELVKFLFHPEHNKLFIVGDPRQSIYRFRGANVNCFIEMIDYIQKHQGELVLLQENFRAQEKLIHFINDTSVKLEEQLLYHSHFALPVEQLKLKVGKSALASPAALLLSIPTTENSEARRKAEAEVLAQFIQTQLAEGRKAKEIALLFRALSNVHIYTAAFERHSIPYAVQSQNDFFEDLEIRDMLAVLGFAAGIDKETQAFHLAHSPWLQLSDDELLQLDLSSLSFAQALQQHAKCKDFLSWLTELSQLQSPSKLLSSLLQHSAYTPHDALDRFLVLLQSLESSDKTFQEVVRDLFFLVEQNSRIAVPNFSDEAESRVQLMTIHASKGLEFPIVILPDLQRATPNLTENFCFVPHVGLEMKWRNPSTPLAKFSEESTNFTELKKTWQNLEEAESQRLLYVALTRAEEMLVFPVPEVTPEKNKNWFGELLPYFEKHATPWQTQESKTEATNPTLFQARVQTVSSPELQAARARYKKAFQVSELECFSRCPQEYYLKYILQLPQDTSDTSSSEKLAPALRGTLLHRTLELMSLELNLQTAWAQACHEFHITDLDPQVEQHLQNSLQQFFQHPLSENFSSGWHEIEFQWKLQDYFIKGTIDWLKPTENGFEIIDFKTDNIQKSEIPKRAQSYELQMLLYTLAAEQALQKPISSATLFFLACNEPYVFTFSPAEKKSAEQNLVQLISQIQFSQYSVAEKLELPCEQTRCNCPFHLNKLCWLDRSQAI